MLNWLGRKVPRPLGASAPDTPGPPDWAADLFVAPLEPVDGGAVWRIRDDVLEATISEQFRSGAGEYHARYAGARHFEKMFRKVLATGLTVAEAPLILDLGSGSGVNSIAPCFALFPGARQVATDLSGDLLAILAGYAAQQGWSDRTVGVVMDAMGDRVRPGRFDLVTGVAILHHLVRPLDGLQAAFRALKPGGHAIFMEPFDGYGLLRLAYERILAEAALRGEALAPEVDRVLRAMIVDISARTLPETGSPAFAAMDDKWLFSREQFEHDALAAGFAHVRFVPHNDHATLYRDMAFVQLRLGTGLSDLTLPDWALAILDGVDAALPGPVKRLLMLEGSVVLTRAS